MPLEIPFPVATGFLPARGSLMLDFVFVAIFVIALVLTFSIYTVKKSRNYRLHKRIQTALAIVVLIAIVAFEIDLRLFTDWRALARESAYYDSGWVDGLLIFHLCFAIPTPFVWLYTLWQGWRNFPSDPIPGEYSRRHRFWGWCSAILMYLTAVTGAAFYVISFVC